MDKFENEYEEEFDVEYEDDEVNALFKRQNRQMSAALYPPGVEGFRVISLFQFLLYVPLLPAWDIYDVAMRVGGTYKDHERYILNLINNRIDKIQDSPARRFADRMAEALSRPDFSYDVQEQICTEYEEEAREFLNCFRTLSYRYSEMEVALAKLQLKEGCDYRIFQTPKSLTYLGATLKAMEQLENEKNESEE